MSSDKHVNKASILRFCKYTVSNLYASLNSWQYLDLAFFHSFILFAALKNVILCLCLLTFTLPL